MNEPEHKPEECLKPGGSCTPPDSNPGNLCVKCGIAPPMDVESTNWDLGTCEACTPMREIKHIALQYGWRFIEKDEHQHTSHVVPGFRGWECRNCHGVEKHRKAKCIITPSWNPSADMGHSPKLGDYWKIPLLKCPGMENRHNRRPYTDELYITELNEDHPRETADHLINIMQDLTSMPNAITILIFEYIKPKPTLPGLLAWMNFPYWTEYRLGITPPDQGTDAYKKLHRQWLSESRTFKYWD